LKKLDIDISEVKKLVELVERHGLEELTVEEGDLSVTVRGHAPASPMPQVVHLAQAGHVAAPIQPDNALPVHAEPVEAHEEPRVQTEEGIADIVAPVVGVFYRAPSPDAPAFVEVGDFIELGTEVGLIEAMKVFSPIPSDFAGEVVAIPAENGKLVQQGDVLVRVRVAEE